MHLIFFLLLQFPIAVLVLKFNLHCFLVYRYKVNVITSTKTSIDPRITYLYTKTADLVGADEVMDRKN
jgi:hypothetical protein